MRSAIELSASGILIVGPIMGVRVVWVWLFDELFESSEELELGETIPLHQRSVLACAATLPAVGIKTFNPCRA